MGEIPWTRHATRQEWVQEALVALRPVFTACGRPVPAELNLEIRELPDATCSYGYCLQDRDGRVRICINGTLRTPACILLTLVHEACHAAVGVDHGHGGPYAALARRIGLVPPEAVSAAGDEPTWRLTELLRNLALKLGAYPPH